MQYTFHYCFNIIIFFNTYYTYLSFDLTKAPVFSGLISSKQSLLIFLITGFIGYNFFYSMVQSAWQMGAERQNGTLETIILSPANWLAVVYGRSLGALFQNVWMFSTFSILIIMSSRSLEVNLFLQIPIAFFILTLSATVWGGLMNVIFLFSRDAAILHNVLDDPMEFFQGLEFPQKHFQFGQRCFLLFFH
ncbi:hypothetical protein N7917_29670 [Bacillus sp. OR9]|nr:hypothetical protein [Bacillus sp. OR9]